MGITHTNTVSDYIMDRYIKPRKQAFIETRMAPYHASMAS